MQDVVTCKVCYSSRLVTLKKYQVNSELSEEWHKVFERILQKEKNISLPLKLCLSCGFVFYGRIFSFEEIKKLYEREGRFENLDGEHLKAGRVKEVEKLFDFFGRYIDFSDIRSVIDVGAGDFVVFDKLLDVYPAPVYTAIDPSYQ